MINRPRTRKILADLWGNRTRSLLVVASIAVGLFAVGVMGTIYALSQADMQRGYFESNPANIYFSGSYYPQGLVDRIGNLAGVRQVEGARRFSIRVLDDQGVWTEVLIQAFEDPAQKTINLLRQEAGRWPPGEGEIVMDRYLLPDLGYTLGDWVTVELPSGDTRQLKLVGVVQDQTIGAFGDAGGFFGAPAQGYIDMDTLESLEQDYSSYFNVFYITVEGDSRDAAWLKTVSDRARDEVEKNNVTIYSTHLSSSYDHPNLYLVLAILGVLLVIGLLVVFLSGFLITNTLQALLNQQVQQIGILKTVGARRLQIVIIYMALNLFYGSLAFAIAMPLSAQVASIIIDFLTVEMNVSYYGLRFIPWVVIAQAGIAVLMPQIAALAPVLSGTRISVQEALSGLRQDSPPDQGWLDRQLSGLRNFSLLLVVALRNTFRRRGRLILTVITLTLGGAVFIATFNVRISMTMLIDRIIQYFLADVNLTLDRSYRIEEISDLVMQVPGVRSIEGWAFARSELLLEDGSVGESVSLLAPPVNTQLVEPILLDGRWIEPGDRNATAVSELFRERFPDLQVGDTLELRVNGQDTKWVVIGFYQLAGKVSGFSAYTSYEYLTELTHSAGRAQTYRIVASQPGLTLYQQEMLGQRIENYLASYGIRTVDITAGLSLSQTAADGFNVLTAFLLFLALLTATVGSIGLTGTMSLNVMERTREIGVLRAIGASDWTLMRMVLVEGALIGMISWGLASLSAFPISAVISESISQALFGGPAEFGFTATGFIIWLGVVIVLSVLASVMPARSATRLTIREVLSYE